MNWRDCKLPDESDLWNDLLIAVLGVSMLFLVLVDRCFTR